MKRYLVLLATIVHLIPHPFGISPVGAVALYSGAFGQRRFSWSVPLIPLTIASVVNGFYDVTVMSFVFAGFALSSAAGWLLTKQRTPLLFSVAAVGGALIFYVVSNFSIWLVGMYPPTVAGLLQCYFNGLPYLGAGITANLVYGVLLFGLHAQIERPQRKTLPA